MSTQKQVNQISMLSYLNADVAYGLWWRGTSNPGKKDILGFDMTQGIDRDQFYDFVTNCSQVTASEPIMGRPR